LPVRRPTEVAASAFSRRRHRLACLQHLTPGRPPRAVPAWTFIAPPCRWAV